MRILILFVFSLFVVRAQAQQQDWFTYDTTNSGIPSNLVTALAIDAQNAVWVGTANGLSKFEDMFSWTYWNTLNSALPNNWINSLTIDASGRIWVGTTGGLAVMQGNSISVYTTQNSPLTSNLITAVAHEGSSAWITTEGGGLYNFNGTTWTRYSFDNTGIDINVCHGIAIDASGNKWIATLSSGLVKLSGTVFTSFRTENSQLPHNFVRSVTVQNDTSIWIGMGYTDNDSSLARFNGSTSFSVFSTSVTDGIPFRNVWDIYIDNEATKWISSNNLDVGVVSYNDTVFTNYSSFNSGLPFNRVYASVRDTGNHWFATMRGLAVFNERNASLTVPYHDPLIAAHVYPNPTSAMVNISLSGQVHQARISIYSSTGICVHKEQWNGNENAIAHIDVSSLGSGFYFGAVEAKGRMEYFKFIKQ